VLSGAAAGSSATGTALASRTPLKVLPASPGAANAQVASGPAGRLLVLAEPASRDWRASLDAHPLPPATAYGWAQAWKLPAAGGRLVISRSDRRGHWLLLELALLVVAGLASVPDPRRREPAEPTDPSQPAVAT
jgi:hypothetical protein